MTVHRHRLRRMRAGSDPHTLRARLARRLAADRGDVPGWVLITLMTAGIVVALWAVASPMIIEIFETAMAPFLSAP